MGSVYHKIEPGDLLTTVVHATPPVAVTSGSSGWRGTVGASSSLSLYAGVRGRTDLGTDINVYPLDPLDTHSIDKVVYVSGSYPSTGSIHWVKVRSSNYSSATDVNADNWYSEHYRPIEGLFEYYKRFNAEHTTASYDYYSLFFRRPASYASTHASVVFRGPYTTISSSYTLMARVKPTVTSSFGDFTIMQIGTSGCVKLQITGSTGNFSFASATTTTFNSSVTSTATASLGGWQHVAFVADGASGSFYVNGALVSQHAWSFNLSGSASYCFVGADLETGLTRRGYEGFIYETKLWSRALSSSEVSASSAGVTWSSGSAAGLVHYARMNDGPLGTSHGAAKGSGALDYAPTSYGFYSWARGSGFISWHPNDDSAFVVRKNYVTASISMMKVLHVPSMFYGRQIATGSLRMTCNAYSNKGVRRVVVDDGRGSLYLSGSTTRLLSGEDSKGVWWRRVGSVFYTEGVVAITDPALLDFGESVDTANSNDLLQVEFRGVTRTPTRTVMCRIGAAEANASNNPSAQRLNNLTGKYEFVREDGVTYITAVGIYDDMHRLVAVAKLAHPIRKRPKDKLDVRIRLDL